MHVETPRNLVSKSQAGKINEWTVIGFLFWNTSYVHLFQRMYLAKPKLNLNRCVARNLPKVDCHVASVCSKT